MAAVSAQASPAVRTSRSARAGDPVMGLGDVRHQPGERHHTRTRDVYRGGCGALVAGGTVDAALVARRPATALPACHPPGADGLTSRYVGRIRRRPASCGLTGGSTTCRCGSCGSSSTGSAKSFRSHIRLLAGVLMLAQGGVCSSTCKTVVISIRSSAWSRSPTGRSC